MLAGAPNYLHLPEQHLAEDNCDEQTPAAFLRVLAQSLS